MKPAPNGETTRFTYPEAEKKLEGLGFNLEWVPSRTITDFTGNDVLRPLEKKYAQSSTNAATAYAMVLQHVVGLPRVTVEPSFEGGCPMCGEFDIWQDDTDTDADGSNLFISYDCSQCGYFWTVQYEYVRTESPPAVSPSTG